VNARTALAALECAIDADARRRSELEADRDELALRLVAAERREGRLMNLYVATYQLYGTLDPVDVAATIEEICVNLLGAERFALLLREDPERPPEILVGKGIDPADARFAGGTYRGGDAMIDASLKDGRLRIAAGSPVAVVPLTAHGERKGALVVLALFEQKAGLSHDDHELLDLMGAHAASALFAARAYAMTDRKLRTLEGLLTLVRGGNAG
jgi:hypothetical protein